MFTTGFGLGMACAEAGPIAASSVPPLYRSCPVIHPHPEVKIDSTASHGVSSPPVPEGGGGRPDASGKSIEKTTIVESSSHNNSNNANANDIIDKNSH